MSKLEKLEEELYGQEGEQLAGRAKKAILEKTFRKPKSSWDESEQSTQTPSKKPKLFPFERKIVIKYALWVLGGILAIGAAAFIFFYFSSKGQEAKIIIYAEDRISSGEPLRIAIVVKNTSNTTLKETELGVVLPEGSLVREEVTEFAVPVGVAKKLGDFAPKEERTVEITARIFGHVNEDKEMKVSFIYKPESLRARFIAKTSKFFRITTVPIGLSLSMPEVIARGQEVKVRIEYDLNAQSSFENVWLKIIYPVGFNYKSANPLPGFGNNIWSLGTLEPGARGVVTVTGELLGEEGETKAFRGELGVFNISSREWRSYNESSRDTKIAIAPLSAQGFLSDKREGLITPGERLNFSVLFKNNTSATLKNVFVNAYLLGSSETSVQDILDFNTLSIENKGVFDAASGAIKWAPGNTKELREIESGKTEKFSFTIQARANPIVRGPQNKNLVVGLKSAIDAADVPQELIGTELKSEDKVEFKVRSKITFSEKYLYQPAPFPNYGPNPAQVGFKTTYAVVWELRNFTNDLQNFEVRTILPPNIKWGESVVSPPNAIMSFNSKSNEVLWRIGNVKAGIGILTPALTAAFQVSLIPAPSDKGKNINLTSESSFSGIDTFIAEDVGGKLEALAVPVAGEQQAPK